MKKLLEQPDLWAPQLIGWILLIGSCFAEGTEQLVSLVGAATMFSVQAIIWRLDDSNKN